MVDPRLSVINARLNRISRIIAVSSGKGGVGKSVVATTLAFALARCGCKVGLFDLDFTGPSTHIIVGAHQVQPKEEKGLIPPTVDGLEYMSLIYFVGDNPTPFRGEDTSNALIELLTITLWGKLDFLVIDMPPGIGDAFLDLVRLIHRIEFLIVTTPSMLAFETVKKQAELLCEQKMQIIGLIENMKADKSESVELGTRRLGLMYLGAIPFDPQVEEAIGKPQKLMQTSAAEALRKIAETAILKGKNQR